MVWRWYYLVMKSLFPLDAFVVWCPTWSKNLGRYLTLIPEWETEWRVKTEWETYAFPSLAQFVTQSIYSGLHHWILPQKERKINLRPCFLISAFYLSKKLQKVPKSSKNVKAPPKIPGFVKKKRYQLINERSRCCAMGFLTMLGSSK